VPELIAFEKRDDRFLTVGDFESGEIRRVAKTSAAHPTGNSASDLAISHPAQRRICSHILRSRYASHKCLREDALRNGLQRWNGK